MFDNKELDICESYNYLGKLFHFHNNKGKLKCLFQYSHVIILVFQNAIRTTGYIDFD